MDKVFLPFYYSWRDKTKNLSDEEFGKLTRAILLYSETGELTSGFTELGEMAYEFITDVIKRSQKKSDDGRKGAYKRWNNAPYSTHIANQYKPNAINKNRNTNINTNRNEEESIKEEKRKRFLPPSLEEVKKYCSERGNYVNAEQFIDFYTAKGWKVGSNPMKDWKAAVRTWERRDMQDNGKAEQTQPQKKRYGDFDADDAFQKALERTYRKEGGL